MMGCHSCLGDANQLLLSDSKGRLILGGHSPTGLGQKLRAVLQEKESRGKDLWVEQSSPRLTARDLGRVAVRK